MIHHIEIVKNSYSELGFFTHEQVACVVDGVPMRVFYIGKYETVVRMTKKSEKTGRITYPKLTRRKQIEFIATYCRENIGEAK